MRLYRHKKVTIIGLITIFVIIIGALLVTSAIAEMLNGFTRITTGVSSNIHYLNNYTKELLIGDGPLDRVLTKWNKELTLIDDTFYEIKNNPARSLLDKSINVQIEDSIRVWEAFKDSFDFSNRQMQNFLKLRMSSSKDKKNIYNIRGYAILSGNDDLQTSVSQLLMSLHSFDRIGKDILFNSLNYMSNMVESQAQNIKQSAYFIVSLAATISLILSIIGALNLYSKEKELDKMHLMFQSVLDAMPSIMIGCSQEGLITLWNPEAHKITNIPAEQAIGKELEQIIPELESYKDYIQDSIINKKTIQLHRQNDTIANMNGYYNITIFPLLLEESEECAIRIDDVTKDVNLEAMMIHSDKMLSLGGLAAGMAHEINNPLCGIMTTVQVLKQNMESRNENDRYMAEQFGMSEEQHFHLDQEDDVMKHLNIIQEEASQITKIVKNMLSFSRTKKQSFSKSNIHKLIDHTIDLAQSYKVSNRKYSLKNITIDREFNSPVNLIDCDVSQIQQVFVNLLQNAIHAMVENETPNPRICVKTSQEDKFIVVEIEDNGVGIDLLTQAHIFEPFYTTKPEGVGTGLGLFVAHFIINDNHGGDISVSSEPGVGTTFIIKLPIPKPTKREMPRSIRRPELSRK